MRHSFQHKHSQTDLQHEKIEWTFFTYYSRKKQRKLQNIIKHNPQAGRLTQNGVHQMKCMDCSLKCSEGLEHFILDIKSTYR
jgi:hypothetical protein